jgi:pimeloyl-ACP methyl ester carboxylesterase
MTRVHTARAGVLDVAFERHGPSGGWPVVLLHGFPYDARCYDDVAPALAAAGADVIVPYLRGYGRTRFLERTTMRSGQQAALAVDLRELIAALGLSKPIVAGFDWGGRAACLTAMLWPQLVRALVSVSGYHVQNIAVARSPEPPHVERLMWYQYYLHGERGRAGLEVNRRQYARLLWQEWSPDWSFTDDQFDATATSFDNSDFVDVVVHSYRHRFGLVAGDQAYQTLEDTIAEQPPITVPTFVIDPLRDGREPVVPPRTAHEKHFPTLLDVLGVQAGHNVPQEAPEAFAEAILYAHRNS